MLSFEFFPPKTPAGQLKLAQLWNELKIYNPEYCSMTFGAGGSTRDTTLKAVQLMLKDDIVAAPHISCVSSTKSEIDQLLQQYINLGVARLVVLRGDLPSGFGGAGGDFQYAYQLVEYIRETTGQYFHIDVAAYPEFHPQAKNAKEDLMHFKMKVQAGANSAITQYFYNTDAYFRFRDDCADMGVHIPIVPGIMPITNFESLKRFSNMCGAEIPMWIAKRMEAYAQDKKAALTFGRNIVLALCERLVERAAPGLHIYTLNQAEFSREISTLLQSKATDASIKA